MTLHLTAESILSSADPIAAIDSDLRSVGLDLDGITPLTVYLAATSRLTTRPVWVTITGETASGKSHVKGMIARMIPDTEQIVIDEASPKALITMARENGDHLDLRGYLLVADEREFDKPDPRYMRTLYETQRLSYRTVIGGKSVLLSIEGCPALFETTTGDIPFDEDRSRRLIVAVSEDQRKYERLIQHKLDRYASVTAQLSDEAVVARQREVQKLLPRGHRVEVPFASSLANSATVAVGSSLTRAIDRLMGLTMSATLLRFRHRRVIESQDGPRIIAEPEDYRIAFDCFAPVFRASVANLTTQGILLAESINAAIEALPRTDPSRRSFTRADITRWTHKTTTTLKRRVDALVERDILVAVVAGGRGRKHYYRLAENWRALCDGECGLMHPDELEGWDGEKLGGAA